MFPDLEFIKTALNAITAKFRHVKSDVDAVQANVDAVQANVDAVQANVDAVQANVDAVKNSAPDWHESNIASHAYIKNKPCYDYIEPSVVIWESNSAGISGQGALLLIDMGNNSIIEGETYKVTVNGVSKEYICETIEDELHINGSGIFQKTITNNVNFLYAWTTWEERSSVKLEGPLRRYKKLDTKFYDAVVSVNGETGEVEITPEKIEAANAGTKIASAHILNAVYGTHRGKTCSVLYLGGNRWFEKGTTSDTREECFLFSPFNTILAGIKTPTQDAHAANKGYVDAAVAAVGERLSNLSEEIVTTSESKVVAHNTRTDTHSDIRLLIQGLTDRLNALADSDDNTLDQLSEVVAYIKSNRELIAAITTDKVSVANIIDNLTTNVANKPLSAAQGVALKALIDAITIPESLPNPNALTFSGAVTGSYDGSAPLEVEIPSGDSGSREWKLLSTVAVGDDELAALITTPTEEEMALYSEILCVFESYTKTKEGEATTTSTSFRPYMTIYTSNDYDAGRIGGDIGNSVGSSTDSRACIMYLTLKAGKLSGYITNNSYAIPNQDLIRNRAKFVRIPQISLNNKDGRYYSAGTTLEVYGR